MLSYLRTRNALNVFATAALGISSCVSAGTAGEMIDDAYHYLVILNGGPGWASPGKDQTITLTTQPVIQNRYVPNNFTSTLGTGGIFLGIEKAYSPQYTFDLGLTLTGSGVIKTSGSVWQDASPDFDNYAYHYKLNQFRLGVKGRALAQDWTLMETIKPYVSAEAAAAWNRSYGYQLSAKADTVVLQPLFVNHTTGQFSYAFGAGLQGEVCPHVQFAVGYEFVDWGASHLGRASGQQTSNTLNLSHLYVNELLFSLIYTH